MVQIGVKLGYSPWSVPRVTKDSVMLIGIELCHSVVGTPESAVALCATVNTKHTQYHSEVKFLERKNKLIISGLGDMILNAIEAYVNESESNNKRDVLPKHIICYRSCVGEGQMETV